MSAIAKLSKERSLNVGCNTKGAILIVLPTATKYVKKVAIPNIEDTHEYGKGWLPRMQNGHIETTAQSNIRIPIIAQKEN